MYILALILPWLATVVSLFFTIVGAVLIFHGNRTGWLGFPFFGCCFVISAMPLLPARWFAHLPLDHFLRRLRNDIEIPDPRLGRLSATSDSLTHTLTDGTQRSISWDAIERITAHKLDLYTTDRICLLFEGSSAELPYEIHEEMVGFFEVVQQMQATFPDIIQTWYSEIMTPAFEAKPTILYCRGDFEESLVRNE